MNDPQPEGHVASHIGRRKILATLGGAAAACPLAARAQQGERMRRIGVLMSLAANDAQGQARLTAFLQGLQQLGWIDGRNVRIDTRWGAGDADRTHRYAAELVASSEPSACRSFDGSGTSPCYAGPPCHLADVKPLSR